MSGDRPCHYCGMATHLVTRGGDVWRLHRHSEKSPCTPGAVTGCGVLTADHILADGTQCPDPIHSPDRVHAMNPQPQVEVEVEVHPLTCPGSYADGEGHPGEDIPCPFCSRRTRVRSDDTFRAHRVGPVTHQRATRLFNEANNQEEATP